MDLVQAVFKNLKGVLKMVFTKQEISETIKKIIGNHFDKPKEEILESTNIIDDLGGCVLDKIELIMCIEETFNIDFNDSDCEKMNTVEDFIKLVSIG